LVPRQIGTSAHHLKLVTTGDGSHTWYVEELNEHYHSTFGALQESMHVYIGHGLRPLLPQKRPLKIFEMGFGTGLNAVLTLLEAGEVPVQYTAVEAFPLTINEIAQLNYPLAIEHPAAKEDFQKIHNVKWEQPIKISPTFTLHKRNAKLEDLNFPINSFDLVYYDAFAPSVQPELWTPEIFKRIQEWMKPGGVLVTYSAKGTLKRTLAALGFTVEHPPGPPGKNEITKATKPI